jgi:uncharacterized damage-inducible protein DinB
MASASVLQTFSLGWRGYQQLLVDALRDLTPEQVQSRAAPNQWAVWQITAHVAGARAYWFHDVFGEGDGALRDMFRVANTTVPGLPIEDAGWEDDEEHPRTASELVDALERTWSMIEGCLERWTEQDLAVEFARPDRHGGRSFSRGWLVWHLVEHDLHHGGEISQTLGTHGLPALDL